MSTNPSSNIPTPTTNTNYSLPLKPKDGTLVVTSDYGWRAISVPGASRNHKGLDFRASYEPLYATENNGKVIKAGTGSGGAGKRVEIEYERPDGTKFRVAYLHMDKIDVKVGDIVNAGDKIGVSGSTGIGTGAHLDFRTKKVNVNGTEEYINPKEYIATLIVEGNLDVSVVHKNGDKDFLDAEMAVARSKKNIDRPMMAVVNAETQQEIADEQRQKTAFNSSDKGNDLFSQNPMNVIQTLMSSENGQESGIIGQLMLMLFAAFANCRNIDASPTATMDIMAQSLRNRRADISSFVTNQDKVFISSSPTGKNSIILETQSGTDIIELANIEEEELLSSLNEPQYPKKFSSAVNEIIEGYTSKQNEYLATIRDKADIQEMVSQQFEELNNGLDINSAIMKV